MAAAGPKRLVATLAGESAGYSDGGRGAKTCRKRRALALQPGQNGTLPMLPIGATRLFEGFYELIDQQPCRVICCSKISVKSFLPPQRPRS